MDLKNRVIYFSDLDDTLFQTKRKLDKGIFQATHTDNPEKVSYYTKEQKEFLNHILHDPNSLIIPITARTKDQYQRTQLFKENLTPIYANYYGGSIYVEHKLLENYNKIIRQGLNNAQEETLILISRAEKYLKKSIQSINVDGYYYVIEGLTKDDLLYIQQLFSETDIDFDIYQNEKNITILPSLINKKQAVKFLCNLLEPKFTIGIGDSISDLEFLNFCDFKIISKIGELNKIINAEDTSILYKII